MIRSVGVGGSNVSNQLPRRTKEVPNTPFPNLSGLENKQTQQVEVQQPEVKKMMVGGKVAPHLRSIFDEEGNVLRKNADGDCLEVSKRAISLAKDFFQ